jgi:hypothetical protein
MYEDLKNRYPWNHGFVKGQSTVSILVEYSSFVLDVVKGGCQVDSRRYLIGSGIVFFQTKCQQTLGMLIVYGWDTAH